MDRRTFILGASAVATGAGAAQLAPATTSSAAPLLDFGEGLAGWSLLRGRPPQVMRTAAGETYLTTRDAQTSGANTCELQSPPFILRCRAIRLNVAGSDARDSRGVPLCRIVLEVDGRPVASAAGTGDSTFRAITLDVTQWKGRSARLTVVDDVRMGRNPCVMLGNPVEALGAWEQWEEEHTDVTPDGKPATGFIQPGLEAIERRILAYMRDYEIPSGSMALSRRGKLLAVRAYGHYDRAETRRLRPTALFRLASVDKPIIRSSVARLAAIGCKTPITGEPVTRELRVFRSLRNAGVIGTAVPIADERLLDVTIGQMVDHTSGIRVEYPAVADIRRRLGLSGMPGPIDYLRWWAGRTLASTPGQKYEYNNTANFLLWHVVHWLSGGGLQFLRLHVFPPEASGEVALAHTRPTDRTPEEVWYATGAVAPSIYPEDNGRLLPVTDGGRDLCDYNIVASARALVGYCGLWYMGDGRPLTDSSGRLNRGLDNGTSIAAGSWDGTFSVIIQRRHSLCPAAVVYNHREERPGVTPTSVAEPVCSVLDGLKW